MVLCLLQQVVERTQCAGISHELKGKLMLLTFMQPFLPSPLYAIIHGPLAVRFGNNLCTILKYVPNPFFQKVLDGIDEKVVFTYI